MQVLAYMCISDRGARTPARPAGRAGTFPEGASAVPAYATGQLSVLALLQRQPPVPAPARGVVGLAGTSRLLDCVAGTPG